MIAIRLPHTTSLVESCTNCPTARQQHQELSIGKRQLAPGV
jgi:hypothetical protein